MKSKIEIEKLLHWAVRDELPKGRPVSADIGHVIGRRMRARPGSMARGLGRMIEADPLGYVPGEPHRDAEAVSDALARLPTAMSLDCEDDARELFGELAAIAEPVVPALMAAVWNPQAIVLSCSAMGRRPPWRFGCPVPYQMFAPTAGRPRPIVHGIGADGELVELRKNEGRARKREGEYALAMLPRSPLNWHDPAPLHIGECRAEWVAWRQALDLLVADLAGKLETIEVQPSALPLMPWRDGASRARLIKGRDLGRADVEPWLAPKRERPAGKPVESPIEAETIASYNRASREKIKKTVAA
ncbi:MULTISPECIES: hypothetical protein [unclassified Bradyrhizobium]|uniref:hypothetical protein n=1 Tax=unclassified Bradyrhizobium TaxID=2631580 RepID=UPI002916B25C|nr:MULTISPECIES: hypothetical protein [unclassified Bradyrhizobium]